jgi:hypothetical protein
VVVEDVEGSAALADGFVLLPEFSTPHQGRELARKRKMTTKKRLEGTEFDQALIPECALSSYCGSLKFKRLERNKGIFRHSGEEAEGRRISTCNSFNRVGARGKQTNQLRRFTLKAPGLPCSSLQTTAKRTPAGRQSHTGPAAV